jgi:hypothetical protein
MQRKCILITDDQNKWLKKQDYDKGIPHTESIRRLIQEKIDLEAKEAVNEQSS